MSDQAKLSLRGDAHGVEVIGVNFATAIKTVVGKPPKTEPVQMIPTSTIVGLTAILKKQSDEAQVVVSAGDDYRFVQVTGENFSWWSALVDAPPYALSIPGEATTTIQVNSAVFLAVCQRCHSFRADTAQYVTIAIDGTRAYTQEYKEGPSETGIIVSSPPTEYGMAREAISTMMYGVTPTLHLDYTMLRDAVQACNTDEVLISVHPKNGRNLVTVRPVGGMDTVVLLVDIIVSGEGS